VRAGKAPKGLHVRDLAEAIQSLRKHVQWHETAASERSAAIRQVAKQVAK
jgi:hypothetical protein